jgi:hypothetical protein
MGGQGINFDDLGGKTVSPPVSNQTYDFSDLGGKVVSQAPGQIRNDVGNTVIVPKPGESFADTMQRAAAYGKTVTPAQINAEVKTAPEKAAETLAAAPALGFGGAAALGGAAAGTEAAGAALLPRVIPATIAGAKAVGAWANDHPLQAYALYKILFEHNAIAKFIRGAPSAGEE